jgi:excisionase family DNA binding protein
MAVELLTVEQVAERLGVTTDSILRWIKTGELRAMQMGGRAGWRIAVDDLQTFLDGRANRPKTDADAA